MKNKKMCKNRHVPKLHSTIFNKKKYSPQEIWNATRKVYTDLGMDDYIEPLKQMLKDSGVTGISWGD